MWQIITNKCKKKFLKKKPNKWDVYVSEKRAAEFLADSAIKFAKKTDKNTVIIFGDPSDSNCLFIRSFLSKNKIIVHSFDVNSLDKLSSMTNIDKIACFICSYSDSKNITKIAKFIIDHEKLNSIDFEYMPVQSKDYRVLLKYDYKQYNCFSFISPLLIEKLNVFDIYEESLNKFRQKCHIRDFMDLSQLIKLVVDNNIDGDIAEFGSFEGHSGYLIANLLKTFNSDKHLYMFDTFEGFPTEKYGIDKIWNDTHPVNYDDVAHKFSDMNNVSLIKGDFKKTFDSASIKGLSLVYIDCDSYRATGYLIKKIYPSILCKGGIMIIEDYGHHPLLGSRVAVHDYFDKVTDCIKFFSQFSGFYIVIKL